MALQFNQPPENIRFPESAAPGQDAPAPEVPGTDSPPAPAAPPLDFSGIIKEVEGVVRAMEARIQELSTLVQENVIDLAISLSQHLLKTEISGGNYDFRAILGDALEAVEALGAHKKITLKVNPMDFSETVDSWRRICGESEVLSAVQLLQDEEIPRASWKVETPEGSILSDMESRLLSLRKSLMKAKGENDAL